MAVKVEKAIVAKERQKTVAEEYGKWLKNNPSATRQRRIKMLDAISDSAYLEGMLKR